MTAERDAQEHNLAGHLAWLYPDPQRPCRCDHAWVSLGSLYGMNMGKGWVRTTSHPDCLHHGTAASRERAARRAAAHTKEPHK